MLSPRRSEWLSLYNVFLDGTKTGDELDRMFPLGTVFALLEPTWKENASGTSTMLRADSPTDFVVLYPDHDLIRSIKWRTSLLSGAFPSSRDFKAEGNRYFAQKKYLLAVKCWTDGIGNTTDSDKLAILHFNRSQANLLLEQYGAAHRDSTRAVELFDPSTPIATTAKALIRSARALEGLRFLDKALKAYDEVLKVVPTSVEARNEKARLERRVKSATTGDYDWSELLDMKLKDGDSLMEGDFVGPIKVTTVAGRGGGRGVLAARDIEVGELLLCELHTFRRRYRIHLTSRFFDQLRRHFVSANHHQIIPSSSSLSTSARVRHRKAARSISSSASRPSS